MTDEQIISLVKQYFKYDGLYDDLRELHNELKKLFDSGVR